MYSAFDIGGKAVNTRSIHIYQFGVSVFELIIFNFFDKSGRYLTNLYCKAIICIANK